MHLLSIITISILCLGSLCNKCPEIYKRFSLQHTYCKSASSSCKITNRGVSGADIKQILEIHNKYRSKVANGKETSAGGLPQAADMMQMVWDEELACVAQKHAEQCVFKHDKADDRRVENFSVGQNIATRSKTCRQNNNKCIENFVPDWNDRLSAFYNEVSFFNKNLVDSMQFTYKDPKKAYGHFTQMVWSSTWRIGCGFVQYKEGDKIKQLYVCNYGPAGNQMNSPMYKRGKPCSACPTNACCCKTCKNPEYEGLCRMNSNSEAPLYAMKEKFLFYCDFRCNSGNCSSSSVGPWKTVKALGGPYIEVILKGGETGTLDMKNAFAPAGNHSCFVVKYRTGATVKGEKVDHKATMMLKKRAKPFNLRPTTSLSFLPLSISVAGRDELQASFTFSVPKGAPPQFLNIQLLSAKNGKC